MPGLPSPRAVLGAVLLAAAGAAAGWNTFVEPHAQPPTGDRFVHMRIWGESGELLLSTWPGEIGELDALEPDRPSGPIRWNPSDTEPAWAHLVPMLERAPHNVTVRVEGYAFGRLALDRVVLDRHLDLPIEGSVPTARAEGVFGNATPGARSFFLGHVPVEVVAADARDVSYRFALDAPDVYPVHRSAGLVVRATPSDDHVRFTLLVPNGEFTAHNNCALPQQTIRWGFYVVESENSTHLTLVRYQNAAERALEGRTVTVEARFVDSARATNGQGG